MKIEPHSDAITDFKMTFPGVVIGVKEIDLIQGIVYLWAQITGPIPPSVYKEMCKMLERVDCRVVINVDSEQPKALRLAKFFGFIPKNQVGKTYIMELC